MTYGFPKTSSVRNGSVTGSTDWQTCIAEHALIRVVSDQRCTMKHGEKASLRHAWLSRTAALHRAFLEIRHAPRPRSMSKSSSSIFVTLCRSSSPATQHTSCAPAESVRCGEQPSDEPLTVGTPETSIKSCLLRLSVWFPAFVLGDHSHLAPCQHRVYTCAGHCVEVDLQPAEQSQKSERKAQHA